MEKRKVGHGENGYSAHSTPIQTKIQRPSLTSPHLPHNATLISLLTPAGTNLAINSQENPGNRDRNIRDIMNSPQEMEKLLLKYENLVKVRKSEVSEFKKANLFRKTGRGEENGENEEGEGEVIDEMEQKVEAATPQKTTATAGISIHEIIHENRNISPSHQHHHHHSSSPPLSPPSNSSTIPLTNQSVLSEFGDDSIILTPPSTPLKHNGHSKTSTTHQIEPISPYTPLNNSSISSSITSSPLVSRSSSLPPYTSSSHKVKLHDESIYTNLVDQLYDEKLRMTDLTVKIKELYLLEEEQRSKVKELSVERDSLMTIRDKLLEELSSKTSHCEEQATQLLNKTNRIHDLEKKLSEFLSREVELKEKVENVGSKISVVEFERDSYLSQRQEAIEKLKERIHELTIANERNHELELRISDLENERDDLMYESSTDKMSVMKLTKELEERREETLREQERKNEYEQKLMEFKRNEFTLAEQLEVRDREFREMSRNNETLMKRNDLLEDRGFRAEKKVEQFQQENEKLKAEFHEMSQANMSFMSRFNEMSRQIAEIQSKADEEIRNAHEIVKKKSEEMEIIQKKLKEFHSHLTIITNERDASLKIQNSLMTTQDSLKLQYRFLEITSRGKTTGFLIIIWLFLLGMIYLLFLDSNLSSSCLARYS